MSSRNSAALGLGSNLGHKAANLALALKHISGFCRIIKVSPVYKTASLLKDDQDSYFNICALTETYMEPPELLACLKQIEKKMGRADTGRWYSRLIDIDIIDFNGVQYRDEKLTIPHPGIAERSFVLYPLRDILPGYIHPISCRSIDNMVKNNKDDLGIIKLGELLWQL